MERFAEKAQASATLSRLAMGQAQVALLMRGCQAQLSAGTAQVLVTHRRPAAAAPDRAQRISCSLTLLFAATRPAFAMRKSIALGHLDCARLIFASQTRLYVMPQQACVIHQKCAMASMRPAHRMVFLLLELCAALQWACVT